MMKLKLNLDITKEFYSIFKDFIKLNECYGNTFTVLDRMQFLKQYSVEDYAVCYGYIKKVMNGEHIFFRHAFLIDKSSRDVIDVTACLWDGFEAKYLNYEYYVFKEYGIIDEYVKDIEIADYTLALYRELHKDELKMYNYLVSQGNTYNSIDLMELLSNTYGHEFMKSCNKYYCGSTIIDEKK
ncbi:MAG: hypothetical protein IJ086_02740 [Clostridium sp.]|nr:hypothetical protein [Clostridium sp.]MBQ8997595.1 hypothetical protein [Clostridium sp.]